MKKLFLCLLLLLVAVCTLSSASIEKQISKMTLDEKIGMLFVIRPDALDLSRSVEDLNDSKANGVKALTKEMEEVYKNYPVGGFAIFAKNMEDPKQLKKLTKDLHKLKNNPLIYIDEEGGMVARIANHKSFDVEKFPNMEDIALTGDVSLAYTLGSTIGAYLHEYGIDVDFAPVADVNTNPNNPVIGKRAFGDDPERAGEMVSKVVEGLHSQKVLATLKHFPGHGDTGEDSHFGYASTEKTWEEMKSCEMIPFLKGIESGAEFIMSAHITAKKIDETYPSTLSHKIITECLREELGYDGIIITDAMAMGAITKEYSSSEAAVLAIEAGVDIILMPENFIEAFDAVKKAVEDGRLTLDRIEESVYRILKAKEKTRR